MNLFGFGKRNGSSATYREPSRKIDQKLESLALQFMAIPG